MKNRLIFSLFIVSGAFLACIYLFLAVVVTPFSFPIWLFTGKNIYNYLLDTMDLYEDKFMDLYEDKFNKNFNKQNKY
jgi:hypothetical protein